MTNANLGELRQFCNFGGDLCSKCEFKSICNLNQGPPPSEGGRVACASTSARRLRLTIVGSHGVCQGCAVQDARTRRT